MDTLTVTTSSQTELADITPAVQKAVESMALDDGILHLFCPHTTAGLTLNENWDADVKRDMLLTIDGHIAPEDTRHRHAEGNSPAHIKTSLVGSHMTLFVEDGRVQLGRWQGVYLAEFDGPRRRQAWLKALATRQPG